MTHAFATAARRPGAPVRQILAAMTLTVCAAVVSTAWAQQPAAPAASTAAHAAHGGSGAQGRNGGHDMQRMHRMHDRGDRAERGHHGGGDAHAFGPRLLMGSPERIGRQVDRMLDGLNASDAQRAQVKEIAVKAAADIRAQMQAGRGLRQKGADALFAPQVDAAAVEAVRQQMLQQHDQVSRRASQAMLDVARVLTPEQRAKVQARMRDAQARMADRRERMQQRMQQRFQERGSHAAPAAPAR